MTRFLLVAPPFVGHVLPLTAVARELERRGDELAWVVHERHVGHLLPPRAAVYGLDDERADELLTRHAARLRAESGRATLAVFDEVFVPLGRETLQDVERAIDDFRPDALFVDEHALGGALAARRTGLPWATSAPSFQLLAEADVLDNVRRWLVDQLAGVQREARLEPVDAPGRSPHAVVVYTTPDLLGARRFPAEYRFVGPATAERPVDATAFPWTRLRRRPRVLVTLGTIVPDTARRVYATAIEAFGDTDVELVVSAPAAIAPPSPPANVIVVPWAPHDALMPHLDAVVCHAGVNTVHEALRHDLPLVLAPVAYDQGFAARAVVDAGAGVAIRSRRLGAHELAAAVRSVLRDPAYRSAAAALGASLRAMDGAAGAADVLHELAARAGDNVLAAD